MEELSLDSTSIQRVPTATSRSFALKRTASGTERPPSHNRVVSQAGAGPSEAHEIHRLHSTPGIIGALQCLINVKDEVVLLLLGFSGQTIVSALQYLRSSATTASIQIDQLRPDSGISFGDTRFSVLSTTSNALMEQFTEQGLDQLQLQGPSTAIDTLPNINPTAFSSPVDFSNATTDSPRQGVAADGPLQPSKFRYFCVSCPEEFIKERGMKRHEEVVHEHRMKFSCDHCDKIYYRKDSYTGHHNTKHQDEVCFCSTNTGEELPKKSAYSCGNCAIYLADWKARVIHVAADQRAGKTRSDWLYSNLIRGLLDQPWVRNHWTRMKQEEYGSIDESTLVWFEATSADLKTGLEYARPKDGYTLALAAIRCQGLVLPEPEQQADSAASASYYDLPFDVFGSPYNHDFDRGLYLSSTSVPAWGYQATPQAADLPPPVGNGASQARQFMDSSLPSSVTAPTLAPPEDGSHPAGLMTSLRRTKEVHAKRNRKNGQESRCN